MRWIVKIDYRILLILAFLVLGPICLSLKFWLGRYDRTLLNAVSHGNIENAKIAIDEGACINMPIRDGSTLLHVLAIHTDDIDFAEFLINQGISPDVINYNGDSAASCARRAGHDKLAEYLFNGMKGK